MGEDEGNGGGDQEEAPGQNYGSDDRPDVTPTGEEGKDDGHPSHDS